MTHTDPFIWSHIKVQKHAQERQRTANEPPFRLDATQEPETMRNALKRANLQYALHSGMAVERLIVAEMHRMIGLE